MQAIIDRTALTLQILANGRSVLVLSDTLSLREALTLIVTTASRVLTTVYPGTFRPPNFRKNPFPTVDWDWTQPVLPLGVRARRYDLILARSMTCSCDVSDNQFNTNSEQDVLQYNPRVHVLCTCGGANAGNALYLLRLLNFLLSIGGEAYLTNSSLRSGTGAPGRYYSYEFWAPVVATFNHTSDSCATMVDSNPQDPKHAGFLGIHISRRESLGERANRLQREEKEQRKKREESIRTSGKGTGSSAPTGIEAPFWGGQGPDSADPDQYWGQNHPLYLRFHRDDSVF